MFFPLCSPAIVGRSADYWANGKQPACWIRECKATDAGAKLVSSSRYNHYTLLKVLLSWTWVCIHPSVQLKVTYIHTYIHTKYLH